MAMAEVVAAGTAIVAKAARVDAIRTLLNFFEVIFLSELSVGSFVCRLFVSWTTPYLLRSNMSKGVLTFKTQE